MEILILLIPLALVLLLIAIGIFFWAMKNDQFDDLDSPAWRILFDDREQRSSAHNAGNGKPFDNTESTTNSVHRDNPPESEKHHAD